MATKKKKRSAKHPGVVLIPPKGRNTWQARWRDPDSGKFKYEAPPERVTTAEGREDWARDKSKKLAQRRMELEGGAPRATGKALKDAVDHYFIAHEKQLRERTRKTYRAAADKLVAWAKKQKIEADDLTRPKLMLFRESLIAAPKRVAQPNAKRGKYVASIAKRSPVSVNQELRSVRTVLGYLRDLDFFVKLTHDDLRRALKRLPEDSERIAFLKSAQLVKLLEAANKHDADCFKETRAEHVGEGRKSIGTTTRYTPIAPFVAFVLLMGCRYDEALKIEWGEIDLEAGEVHLTAAKTKTHRSRTVDLEVSPALRALLTSMRPKNATGSVFGLSRNTADAARKRLKKDYSAPAFSWQMLRKTCGTYLTNAPGIFGAASAYRSAKQLGHSVTVAEKHYVGLVKVPREATSLEDAMGITAALPSVAAPAPDAE